MNQELEVFIAGEARASLPPAYWSVVDAIPSINETDKVIWSLANQWLQTKKPDLRGKLHPDVRETVHGKQSRLVGLWCKDLAALLPPSDLDAWFDKVNWELRNLRRFNDSLLGFFFSIGQLSDKDATYYNCLAWYQVLDGVLLADAAEKLRRSLPQEHVRAEAIKEIIERALAKSEALFDDFISRFSVTKEEFRFLLAGLELAEKAPDQMPWSEFAKLSDLRHRLPAPRHFE